MRPLDEEQNQWEISHDFLVPLLDSILARWSVSLWRRTRPWLPWILAGLMVVAVRAASIMRPDPIHALADLGWSVDPDGKGNFNVRPVHISRSAQEPMLFARALPYLERLGGPVGVYCYGMGTGVVSLKGIEVLRDLKNLTSLNLPDNTGVVDVTPLDGLKNLTRLYCPTLTLKISRHFADSSV